MLHKPDAAARIRTLADRLDNADTMHEEMAARNLVTRQPAYWVAKGYKNKAPVWNLLFAANSFASLVAAERELAALFAHHNRTVADEQWLDGLLPLNEAAVADLERAYRRAGSFRTAEELRRRTDKAEGVEIEQPDASYSEAELAMAERDVRRVLEGVDHGNSTAEAMLERMHRAMLGTERAA